jgi:hypothetical protein
VSCRNLGLQPNQVRSWAVCDLCPTGRSPRSIAHSCHGACGHASTLRCVARKNGRRCACTSCDGPKNTSCCTIACHCGGIAVRLAKGVLCRAPRQPPQPTRNRTSCPPVAPQRALRCCACRSLDNGTPRRAKHAYSRNQCKGKRSHVSLLLAAVVGVTVGQTGSSLTFSPLTQTVASSC